MIKHKKTTTIKKEWRESVCVERQHTANKITWSLSFLFFSLPSCFLIKDVLFLLTKKKTVVVVLLLLKLRQSSAAPLSFSRHICS
jgi:hypothetical protein